MLPGELIVLPLKERPFFPAQVMPILVDREHWLATVDAVGNTEHRMIMLVLTDAEHEEQARPRSLRKIGTVVRMHNPTRSDEHIHFIAQGMARCEIVRWVSREPPFRVRVRYPDAPAEDPSQLKAWSMAIIEAIKELLPLNPLYKEELRNFVDHFSPNDPSAIADFAANLTTASREELQQVLETVPLIARMEKVLVLVKHELEVARLQARIRERVQETINEQQRKFFLREQLKEIQKELGLSKDDRTAEIERFRERLDSMEPSAEAGERIGEELQKLAVLETGSPEYTVTRNYLDWLTVLPWGRYSEDRLDLKHARSVLDAEHYGLEDVKERVIEFLAVGRLRGRVGGSMLLLVGPPGVGKTSIGRSIAHAVGREFYRFSVGGMRDEAEIKGHRRTYIGAMPGKFIQAIKAAGVANPVIMLDEVDKIGASFHGDPASALLEVLDPAQNADFLDHYLDVRFDLSRCLFVCTANQLDTIPAPLLNRMEVLRLAGYLTEEKVQIARRHLWPTLLADYGLNGKRLSITEAAIRRVVEGYAREAGVRTLEKRLRQIARKAIVELLDGRRAIRVGVEEIVDYLGEPLYRRQRTRSIVGVVTGLAWTSLGGAVLDVESSVTHHDRRGFKLTGQLGGVMKESAELAYSYIAANAARFGADPAFFSRAFVHVHVPEGATPKDGPSAGITIASALLSLARGRRPRRALAMTGELTLTGQVLPIGGVREKLTAAKRALIREVILPEDNRRDYDELPEHVCEGLEVHFVDKFPQVVEMLF